MTYREIKEAYSTDLEDRLRFLRIDLTWAWTWDRSHEIQCITNELARRGISQDEGEPEPDDDDCPRFFYGISD
jgi:hypothetical protein